VGQNGPGKHPHATHVRVESLFPALFGERFGGPRQKHPGVIHQNVNPFEFFECGFDQRNNIALIGNVTCDWETARSNFRCSTFQLFSITSADDHLCAFADKSLGNGLANAASTTGHNGNFVGQTHAGIVFRGLMLEKSGSYLLDGK
jgi:hypothetical protein